MRAFWKYDTFPYVLSAPVVGEILKGGRVRVSGYDNMLVQPIALYNDEEGREVAEQINQLRLEYEEKKQVFHNWMVERVRTVAPFMKDVKV